jgi:hypothetical protein
VGDAKTGECIICDCGRVEVVTAERTLTAEDSVDFCIHDKELGEVAELIRRVTKMEVLVPASEMRKSVSLKLEGATIGDGLKELGLFPAPPASGS